MNTQNKIVVTIDEDQDTVTFCHEDGVLIDIQENPEDFLLSIPNHIEIEMHFCRQNKVFTMRRLSLH